MGERKRPRRWSVVVALVLVAGACSADDSPVDDTAGEATNAESDAESDADGEESADPQADSLEVVDPDAVDRCDRYGYPCTWAEADDGTWERSLELLGAVGDILGDEEEALAGPVAAATAMLADQPDVVELHPQLDTLTAIVFRVEGAPEVIALTQAADPAGVAGPGITHGEEVVADLIEAVDGRRADPVDSPDTEPTADEEGAFDDPFAAEVQLVSYDPTHGPLSEPRKALIVDPNAGANPTGWTEGAAVAAIFGAKDFAVNHLTTDVTFESLADLSNYDAVHINTHGETWCPRGPDGQRQFGGERCWSGFMLGPIDATREVLPAGVTVSLERSSEDNEFHYWVYDRYIEQLALDQDLTETVVMLSSCEGAGLAEGYRRRGGEEDVTSAFRTPMMAQFGSVLAWDQVVTAEGAAAASIAFWTLMVEEGVDAEVAYAGLQSSDLDSDGGTDEVVAILRRMLNNFPRASLQFGGGDKRVRDVIETQQGGAEIADDSDIEVEGVLGDSNHETIAEIQFLVEGVEEGTESSVEIQVYIDGDKLPEVINLEGNSSRVGGGPGYGHWLVNVEDLDIGRDLTPGNVDPQNPTDFRWEARVSDDGFSRWSAHEADPVHFVIDVEAKGPLPIFTQLDNKLPGNADLEGNELRIRFNSGGGPIEGDFEAVITETTAGEVGIWAAQLEGSYDAESGSMSGTAVVAAQGQIFGTIVAGDLDSNGTWEATVDWGAKTVTGVLSAGDGSQPFTARF